MGEFSDTYFRDLKDDVLKEMHRGSFGLFVDAWSLCEYFNMDYNSESSFLESRKKVEGQTSSHR